MQWNTLIRQLDKLMEDQVARIANRSKPPVDATVVAYESGRYNMLQILRKWALLESVNERNQDG